MDKVLKILDYDDQVKNLIKDLKHDRNHSLIHQLNEPVDALLLLKIFEENKRSVLYVAQNLFYAQKMVKRLNMLVEDTKVNLYPVDEFFNVELLASSGEFRTKRLNTLISTLGNEPKIYVTYVAGYTRPLMPKGIFKNSFLNLELNAEYELIDFKKKLIELGYSLVHTVETQSQFSMRGGIVDIFPINTSNPVRIEFFGDEIDSIRYFRVDTQTSIDKVERVVIPPVYEIMITEEIQEKLIQYVKDGYEAKIEQTENDFIKDNIKETLAKEIADIENYSRLSEYQKYINIIYDEKSSISDYLEDPIVIFNNYTQTMASYNEILESATSTQQELIDEGKLLSHFDYVLDVKKLISLEKSLVYFEAHLPNNNIAIDSMYAFEYVPNAQYFKNVDILISDIKRWQEKQQVLITVNNDKEKAVIKSLIEEKGMKLNDISYYEALMESDNKPSSNIFVMKSNIDVGFSAKNLNLQVVTFVDIYGETVHKTPNNGFKHFSKDSVKIKSHDDLQIGDYLVHETHGIGRYIGIENISTSGSKKDFLKIAYQGTDVLFVPIDSFDLVQKYIGKEGLRPKIHKLGSTSWTRQKNNVKKKVQDIADRLVKVYTEREKREGHKYEPDTQMQNEFESNFKFIETPDQEKAIEQVKKDMESKKPMDRLICGDVGYGKTEVAIRAAFKAVMDGKQVAFLAPTTILTHQHYQTLLKRVEGFPVNVALLNRFVTAKKQNEILKNIEKGYVDIVVGTHRLLSKDVKFKDLGLLVIDEEQRFGVLHKERIKELKVNVDILTLTATPIPRTLQMSLVGIRSLSTINTPPKNRYPVQTYVVEESDTVIKNAIEREISRDGQVLYLYNIVEDIETKVAKVSKLVPEAKVRYAHGQMKRVELEKTILDFIKGDFNVLVCTTIIETGMDIPSANTLIVSNADKFGLSQLYQIRGRVGRSDRIAYAYFAYKKDKILSEIALKRLDTIKNFTELGSGFKIAMQDLAIRGAGDILGAEQSGFIDSVGFNMYNQLLKEAIEEAKDSPDEIDENTSENEIINKNKMKFSLMVDTYIPSSYIYDEGTKIDLYKRIRQIDNTGMLKAICEELLDRFGKYPTEVENLLTAYLALNLGTKMEVIKIVEEKKFIEIVFSKVLSTKVDGNKLFEMINNIGENVKIIYKDEKIMIYIEKIIDEYITQLRKVISLLEVVVKK